MYLAGIVEIAPCDDLVSKPHHSFSKALLARRLLCLISQYSAKRTCRKDEIYSAINPPSGYHFHRLHPQLKGAQ
jgi:ABC-type dipeptide/oligopeptide/nickel transport system ATPase component